MNEFKNIYENLANDDEDNDINITTSNNNTNLSDIEEKKYYRTESFDDDQDYDEENYHSMSHHKINKNLFCLNCGKKGHITKKCNYPIISIGVLCIKFRDIDLNSLISYSKKIQNKYMFPFEEIEKMKSIYLKIKNINSKDIDDDIQYLLIRRRNSLSFVDFMRGKYELDDYEYIFNSINYMTNDEKNMISTYSFDYLWKELWSCNVTNIYNNEYEESKNKFTKLSEGYTIKKNEINFYIKLNNILELCDQDYYEPEWGFPKGRRNLKEKNIECAKREFFEETGVLNEQYNIINISPLEEIYLGSNHIRYKHIYYFGQILDQNIEIKIDPNNNNQKVEIGDIKWYNYKNAIQIIRNYNREKKNIILNIHNFFKYLILHFIHIFNDFSLKNNI